MANTKITTRVIADDAITSDKLASGLTLGGDTTLSGHVDLANDKRIRLGDSDELQLHAHNSGYGHVQNTGTLYIDAEVLEFRTDNDDLATALTLNAAQLATFANGITATAGTGTVTATTFSGALSGTIASATTATTQSASDNTTKVATTAYVTTAVSNLVDSSPSALNTLNELAAALGDDANFSTTVTNSIALKAPLASPDFTGQVQVTNSATTVQEFIVTGNNTRSALSMQSKDSSGNAVDLRMHSLGDGPRGEIFTYTNHDLAFATNNAAPQLTLKTNGNLGLGTGTNVDELLHIEKSSGTTIVKTQVAANSTVGFEIQKTGSTTSNWRIVDGQTVNGSLEIYDVTDSRQVMVFDGDGDIGMGVSPATHAKLTLGGTATSYSSVLAFDNNTTGGAEFFMLASDNTWNAGGNKFLMGHGSPSSANVDVAITSDGYLGVGTSSPNKPLEISSNDRQLRLSTGSEPTNYYTEIFSPYNSTNPFTMSGYYNGTAVNFMTIAASSGFGSPVLKMGQGMSYTSLYTGTKERISIQPTQGSTYENIHENFTGNLNLSLLRGMRFARAGSIADDTKIKLFQGSYTYSGGTIDYVITDGGGSQNHVGSGTINWFSREAVCHFTLTGTNVSDKIVVNADTSNGTYADGKFTIAIRATNGDSHMTIMNRLGATIYIGLKVSVNYVG